MINNWVLYFECPSVEVLGQGHRSGLLVWVKHGEQRRMRLGMWHWWLLCRRWRLWVLPNGLQNEEFLWWSKLRLSDFFLKQLRVRHRVWKGRMRLWLEWLPSLFLHWKSRLQQKLLISTNWRLVLRPCVPARRWERFHCKLSKWLFWLRNDFCAAKQ